MHDIYKWYLNWPCVISKILFDSYLLFYISSMLLNFYVLDSFSFYFSLYSCKTMLARTNMLTGRSSAHQLPTSLHQNILEGYSLHQRFERINSRHFFQSCPLVHLCFSGPTTLLFCYWLLWTHYPINIWFLCIEVAFETHQHISEMGQYWSHSYLCLCFTMKAE